ncbi:rRNA cytosine-C5-methyltransferase [Aeromicrobium sp. 636]|uniref:RsmB/NOP family class I SAM-dependent RNA methyltransferase n=1 Tax=Aeromicrobium senzhongii TaxID=2663859 RepID=A0A8I0JYT1_9ACTN|nr:MULTISPECIES: RsmB/NOP family class I SAM-dependent RNA methyltransferase [Aeromicrobium]MBC9225217.1 RsmB/NOP family class I SAM-dependent RNA methyltransferase [Aeromicrobium senzhongii]MCQ3997327.1 rRNA cytosine-C5-methyltransferase [Aeromicrobium sp. 636]
MSNAITDPREVAFEVMSAVRTREVYVNLLLPTLLGGLSERDAALATELTHNTIRNQGTYDAIIDRVATGTVHPAVRDALRLGTHQLLAMRVPPHAAVDTTVNLVRRRIGHRPVGFTNAVLRKIGQKDLGMWINEVTAGLSRLDALAVRYSHPTWVVEALEQAVGADQLEDLLEADNVPPYVTLVARPGLVDPRSLPGETGRLSPYARVMTGGGDPGFVPAVRDGRAGVQDEGSQMVAITTAEAPIEGYDTHWLDLAAGPGGKAALLGALAAQRGATLVANEMQPHRAELVRQSVKALKNVEVTVFDGREGPWEEESFDRVLLDAPCTGLGALRRRPEARWRRKPEDVPELVTLQRELLGRAVDLVRPGGVVGYATCSPLLAETREVVDAVLADRPDLKLESEHHWWPHTDGTDAMYLAIVRRS